MVGRLEHFKKDLNISRQAKPLVGAPDLGRPDLKSENRGLQALRSKNSGQKRLHLP
jgi:hypothetical protein